MTESIDPACRTGATEEDLLKVAERAVLYGAVLAAQRPGVRLKPAIADAAHALAPAVRAFLAGADDDAAQRALAYARACDAEEFLVSKKRRRGM
jgi:hypothetical protein